MVFPFILGIKTSLQIQDYLTPIGTCVHVEKFPISFHLSVDDSWIIHGP